MLMLSLIPAFSSCADNPRSTTRTVVYYYRTTEAVFGSENGVVTGEIRDATGHAEDYKFLIEQYLNGPVSNDLISPFPAGITLEELNIDSNKVQIMLSPHLALLSGSELMTACACLTNTLTEMTGLQTVQISSEGGLLNGMEVLTLTGDSFTYWDESVQFIKP